MVTGGDYVSTEIEELFGDCGREAEAAGGIFTVDDEEIDGMSLEQVGQVLACNVPARGAEYVAYKQNLHCTSLYG
jgi:hypothetical protein